MSETKTAEPNFSFAPSAQVASAPVDFKGTIVAARFGKFKYKNQDAEQTALIVRIKNDDNAEAKERVEEWSVGKASFVSPTNDAPSVKDRTATEEGNFLMRTKDGAPLTGLPKGSIAAQMTERMIKVGMNESEFSGPGADIFVGLQFQFGLDKTDLAGGGKSEKDRLVPTKFYARVKVDGSSAAPAASAVPGTIAVDEAYVAGLVLEVVAEVGGSIKKSDLSPKVTGKVTDAKTKSEVVKILLKPDFLKGVAGTTFDGIEIKLA